MQVQLPTPNKTTDRLLVERLWALLPEDKRVELITAGTGLVEVNIDTNIAFRRGVSVKLTPSHAVILFKLAAAYPKVVKVTDLMLAVHGYRTAKSPNTIRIMVDGLRKRVAPLHATIENKYGEGYRLELAI